MDTPPWRGLSPSACTLAHSSPSPIHGWASAAVTAYACLVFLTMSPCSQMEASAGVQWVSCKQTICPTSSLAFMRSRFATTTSDPASASQRAFQLVTLIPLLGGGVVSLARIVSAVALSRFRTKSPHVAFGGVERPCKRANSQPSVTLFHRFGWPQNCSS